jgi:hypothetical protein
MAKFVLRKLFVMSAKQLILVKLGMGIGLCF